VAAVGAQLRLAPSRNDAGQRGPGRRLRTNQRVDGDANCVLATWELAELSEASFLDLEPREPLRSSSVPILAALELCLDRRRALALDPRRRRPRSVGRAEALGDDALGAKRAGVDKDAWAVAGDMTAGYGMARLCSIFFSAACAASQTSGASPIRSAVDKNGHWGASAQ
jgi:hypothetical protein